MMLNKVIICVLTLMLNVEGGKPTFSISHDDLEKLKRGATPSLGTLPHLSQAYTGILDDTTATSDASSLPSSLNTSGSPNWSTPPDVSAPLDVSAPPDVSAPLDVSAPPDVSAPLDVSAPPDVSEPLIYSWRNHLFDGLGIPSPGTAVRSSKFPLAQESPQTQHTIQFFNWLHSPDPSVQEEKILIPVSSESHVPSAQFPLLYKAQTYQPLESQTLEYPSDSNSSFDVSQERPSPPPSAVFANPDYSGSLGTILYPEESTVKRYSNTSIAYQDSSSNLQSSVFQSNTRIVYPDSSKDSNFNKIIFPSTTKRTVNEGYRKTTPSNTRIVYPDSSTDSSLEMNSFTSPDAKTTDVTSTPASNTNFTTQTSKPIETDIKIVIDVPPRCHPPCERQAGPVCIIDHFCLRIGTGQKPG